jgi:hypothetical protein
MTPVNPPGPAIFSLRILHAHCLPPAVDIKDGFGP